MGPGQSRSWKRVLSNTFYAGEVGQPPPQHGETTISANTINKGDSPTLYIYSEAKLINM